MGKAEAEAAYITLANELFNRENPGATVPPKTEAKGASKYEAIVTSLEFGNIFMIKFNRPKKYNAMNGQVM